MKFLPSKVRQASNNAIIRRASNLVYTAETELNSFDTHRDGAARVRGDHEASNTEPQRSRRSRAAKGNNRQNRRLDAHAGERLQAELHAAAGTPDALELFLRRARVHPLLTASEEIELAKRIERGDLEAKERMINSNLRLV